MAILEVISLEKSLGTEFYYIGIGCNYYQMRGSYSHAVGFLFMPMKIYKANTGRDETGCEKCFHCVTNASLEHCPVRLEAAAI
jgi:hypothetical protein